MNVKKKRFVSWAEASRELVEFGDDEALRQAILFGKLPVYVELNGALGRLIGEIPSRWGNSIDAQWSLAPSQEDIFLLSGWFVLEHESFTDCLRTDGGSKRSHPSVQPAEWQGSDGWFLVGQSDARGRWRALPVPRSASLWFRATDIERVSASNQVEFRPHQDKPLGARERSTLLKIIGAIADHPGKLDLSQPHKAGGQVEALLAAKGITLAARTIGEHLKAVRRAMNDEKS